MQKTLITMALAVCAAAICFAQDTTKEDAPKIPQVKSPAGAKVYIISPKDGATVGKKFLVQFGLKGMGVAPATIQYPNTGHHHLLIDANKLPSLSLPLVVSDTVRHFGGGQTEAEIELPPGKHTLQLVLADHIHLPHDPPVISEKITVTVK